MSDHKIFYAELSILKFVLPGGRSMVHLLLVLLAYTAFVIWWDDSLFPTQKLTEYDSGLFSTAAMGILLVFRINSAYDRWWEGRKLWGQLVNDIRNFSLKINQLLASDNARLAQLNDSLMLFPGSLRDHLREIVQIKNGAGRSGNSDSSCHNPLQCASSIFKNLIELKREGCIDGFELLQIDLHARALMDICGGCERIVKSPISGSFKLLIWAGIMLYLGFLPWVLVPVFDLWSLLLVFISAYFVLGLEMLAEDIERPFGLSPNDLPLDSICVTIEKSVQEVMSAGKADTAEPAGCRPDRRF